MSISIGSSGGSPLPISPVSDASAAVASSEVKVTRERDREAIDLIQSASSPSSGLVDTYA